MTTQKEADLQHDAAVVVSDRADADEPGFRSRSGSRRPAIDAKSSAVTSCVFSDIARVVSHGILASSLPEPCRVDCRMNQRESLRMLEDVHRLVLAHKCRMSDPESRTPGSRTRVTRTEEQRPD